MRRALFTFACVFALACTDDPADESASETAGSETETDSGASETATGETAGETDSTETGGGPYGHGNLHPDCMGESPRVVFETNMGDMTVELDAVHAPITVANFLGYVSSEFYDGTIFHRVIDGFVIQGGGYEPGMIEKTTVGPIVLEIAPELRHDDGAIAMARRQEPDTAESQWYICDGAQHGLDDQYAVFGVLIEGFEVRDAISGVAVQDVPAPFTDVPVEDVVVERAYCVMQ
ncbi:peptidylprolyl isomerase [Nannocystaceae bacterium ST9]